MKNILLGLKFNFVKEPNTSLGIPPYKYYYVKTSIVDLEKTNLDFIQLGFSCEYNLVVEHDGYYMFYDCYDVDRVDHDKIVLDIFEYLKTNNLTTTKKFKVIDVG